MRMEREHCLCDLQPPNMDKSKLPLFRKKLGFKGPSTSSKKCDSGRGKEASRGVSVGGDVPRHVLLSGGSDVLSTTTTTATATVTTTTMCVNQSSKGHNGHVKVSEKGVKGETNAKQGQTGGNVSISSPPVPVLSIKASCKRTPPPLPPPRSTSAYTIGHQKPGTPPHQPRKSSLPGSFGHNNTPSPRDAREKGSSPHSPSPNMAQLPLQQNTRSTSKENVTPEDCYTTRDYNLPVDAFRGDGVRIKGGVVRSTSGAMTTATDNSVYGYAKDVLPEVWQMSTSRSAPHCAFLQTPNEEITSPQWRLKRELSLPEDFKSGIDSQDNVQRLGADHAQHKLRSYSLPASSQDDSAVTGGGSEVNDPSKVTSHVLQSGAVSQSNLPEGVTCYTLCSAHVATKHGNTVNRHDLVGPPSSSLSRTLEPSRSHGQLASASVGLMEPIMERSGDWDSLEELHAGIVSPLPSPSIRSSSITPTSSLKRSSFTSPSCGVRMAELRASRRQHGGDGSKSGSPSPEPASPHRRSPCHSPSPQRFSPSFGFSPWGLEIAGRLQRPPIHTIVEENDRSSDKHSRTSVTPSTYPTCAGQGFLSKAKLKTKAPSRQDNTDYGSVSSVHSLVDKTTSIRSTDLDPNRGSNSSTPTFQENDPSASSQCFTCPPPSPHKGASPHANITTGTRYHPSYEASVNTNDLREAGDAHIEIHIARTSQPDSINNDHSTRNSHRYTSAYSTCQAKGAPDNKAALSEASIRDRFQPPSSTMGASELSATSNWDTSPYYFVYDRPDILARLGIDACENREFLQPSIVTKTHLEVSENHSSTKSTPNQRSCQSRYSDYTSIELSPPLQPTRSPRSQTLSQVTPILSDKSLNSRVETGSNSKLHQPKSHRDHLSVQRLDNFGQVDPDLCLSPGSIHGDGYGIVYDALDVDCTDSDDSEEIYEKLDPDWCKIREHVPVSNKPLDDEIYTPLSSKTHSKSKISSRSESNGRSNVQRGRSASAHQTKIHKRQCQKKIPGNEDPRPGLSISTSLNSSQTSVASGASEPDQTGPSPSIAKRPLKKPAPLNVSKKLLHSTATDTPGDVQSQRSPTNKSRISGVQVRGAAHRQQDRAETDSSHNKAVIADNADKKTGRKHSIPGPISPKRLPVPAPTSDSTKPGSPRLVAIQSQQQKSIKNVSTDAVVGQSPGNGKCKSGKNTGVSPVSSPRRLTAGKQSKLPGYKRSASDSGQVTSAVTTTTASAVHEASTRAPVVVGTSSIPGTVSKPASYKATYLSTPESLTNTKMTPTSTSATLASLKPLTVNPASTSSVSATLSTAAVFTTTPASTSTSTCSDQPNTVTLSSSSSSSLHQPAQLTMHTHPSMARLVSLRETKTDLKCTPDTRPKPHEDILLRVREGIKLSEASSSGQKALISGKRDAATNTQSVLQILRQRGLIKPKAIDTSTKQTSTPQAGEKTNVAEAISPSDKGDPIKDGTAGTKMMRAEEDGGIVEALHCSNKMPELPCATKDAVPMQGYDVMNSERRSADEMKDDKIKWEAGVGSLGEEMLKGSLHHPNTRRVSSQGNSHNQGHAALNSTIKDLSSNYPASVSSPPASVPLSSDDNIKKPADIPQQCSTTRLGVENASSNSEGASSAEGIVVGGGDQRTIIGNYCKPNAAQERCAAVQSHAGLTSGSRSIMDDSISNTTQTDASNHVACSRSYSMQSSNGTSPMSSMPQTCQPRLVKPYSSLSRSQPYSARFNLLSRGRLSTTNVPSTGCESNVVNSNGVLQMTSKMASSSDPTLHNHRYTPERCAVPEHSLSSSAGPALLSPPQETNKQRQENMNGRCMSKHCMNGKENISEKDLQNKNSLGTSTNEQDGIGELGAPGKTREGGNEVAMVRGKLSQTQLVVPEGEMTDCALTSNVRVSSTQTSPEASNNTSTPSHSNATLLSDPHVPANTRKNTSSEHCETGQKDGEAGTTCASAGAGVEGGTTRNTSWNVVGEMKDEGVKRGTSPTRYPGASSYPEENMVELILSNQLPKDDKMVGYVDNMEAASGVAAPPPVHAHTNNEEEVDSAGLLPTLRSLDGGLDNASRAASDVNWRPTCWRRGGDKEGHLVATDEGQLRGRISGSHNEADRAQRSNDSASAGDGHRVSNDQKSPGGLNEGSGLHPSGDEYPPGGQHPTYDHHTVHNICALVLPNSVPANLPSGGNISHPYTSLPTSAQPTGLKAHVGVPRGDIDVHKQCPPSSASATTTAAAAARVDSTDNKADMLREVLEKSNGECSRQKTQAPVNNKQFDRLMGETECESSLECSMNELNGSPKWKQNGPANEPFFSNRSIQGRLTDNESSADLSAVNGDEGLGRLSHRERSGHETQPHIDQSYKSALGSPMGRSSCSLEDGENNSNDSMSQEPEVNSQEFMATNSHDPSVSCSPWPALVATCYHSSLIRASPKMHGYVSWVGQHGLKSHSETDCTSVLSTLHYPSMPKIASHRATSRRLGMATYAVCPELSISEASIPYVDTGVTMTTEFNESLPAGFQPWTRDGLLGTYIHYRYSAPSQQFPYYNANHSHYQQHHPDFISNIRLSESGYDSWKSHDSTSTAAHRDSLDESDDLIGGKHELDPDVFFHSSTNSGLTDVDTLRPMRLRHAATSCAHAYSGFSKHYPGVSYYSGDTCSSNDTILATEHETHEITTTKYSSMQDASILIPTYADYISNPLSDIRGSIPVGLEKVLSGGGVLKVASPVNIGMPFSSQSDPSCDALLDCKNQDDASSPSDSTQSYIALSDHNFAKTDSDETIHGEEVGVKSGEVVAFDSDPAGAGGEGQDLCGVSEGCDGQTVSIPSVIALSRPTNVSPTSKSSIHDIVTASNREETSWCPRQLHQPNIAQLPPNIAQSGIAPMAPVCSQHRMTPVSLNPPQQKLGVAILKEAGGVTTAVNDDSVGRPLTLGDHASQATYNAAGAGEISKAECLKDACHEASLPTHQHQQPEEENRCSNNELSDLTSITAVEASSNNAPMPGSQHPHLTANYHESNSDPFSAALSDEEATERLQRGASPAGEEGAILHPLHPRTYTPPDELMTDLHGSSSLLAPHRSHLPDQQSSDQAMTYDSIVTLNLPSNGIYEPVCLNTDDVMTGSDTTVLTSSSHTYESIEESNMSASTHSYESIDEDLMKRCEAHSTSLQPSAIVPFVHVKEMTRSMKQEGEKSNSAPDIPHTGVGPSYLTDEAHLKRAGKMAELNVDVSADAVSEVPHHVIKETAVSESSLHAEYSLDLELTPTEGTYVSIERTPSRDSLLDAVEGNSQTPEQPILLNKGGGDDDTTPTGDTPVEYHPTFILPAPVKEHLPLSPKCPSPPVKIPSKLWFSGFKVKPRKKTGAIPKHMSHHEDATTSRVELDVHCRQQKPKDGVKLEEIYERKVSQMASGINRPIGAIKPAITAPKPPRRSIFSSKPIKSKTSIEKSFKVKSNSVDIDTKIHVGESPLRHSSLSESTTKLKGPGSFVRKSTPPRLINMEQSRQSRGSSVTEPGSSGIRYASKFAVSTNRHVPIESLPLHSDKPSQQKLKSQAITCQKSGISTRMLSKEKSPVMTSAKKSNEPSTRAFSPAFAKSAAPPSRGPKGQSNSITYSGKQGISLSNINLPNGESQSARQRSSIPTPGSRLPKQKTSALKSMRKSWPSRDTKH